MRYKTWKELPLWDHQRDALNTLAGYLDAPGGGSSLVRMPTGTGKTGVIATVARCFPDVRNLLIVAPWKALRDQLIKDITWRFWERAEVDPSQWPLKAQSLLPSTIGDDLRDAKGPRTAYVGTIPALQATYAREPRAFAALSAAIDLVIVDEGHREPAPLWATAVRALGKPTILMTATPYRNDHKLFNVRPDSVFAYHHHSAVEDRYIRRTEFHELDFKKTPADFVDTLLRFHTKTFGARAADRRVIIRCERDTEINAIATELSDRGRKVVAIHERFEDDDFYAYAVPDPDTHDVQFWVHQNKLIEGIDDPRFSLLAIYGAFTNARALVQQVGRVLRNPKRTARQVAHVLAHTADRQRAFWEGYLNYEQDFEQNPTRVQLRQQFFTAVQQQPEFEYVDGTYRKRFDVDQEPMYEAFKYPQSANVYSLRRNFDAKAFTESLLSEWRKLDREVLKTERPDDDTWVHTYVTAGNSPLLRDQALLHYKLGYTIYHRDQSLLFFYDSDAAACEALATMAQTVSPTVLQRLFAGGKSRLSRLSLMNTDLGRQSVRRRMLQAYSVTETAPGLVDHIHFCSTASGYAGDDPRLLQRRYVGFTKGRVSDKNEDRVDFEAYLDWMTDIADALRESGEAVELFDRFADFVAPPEDPDARNILFDLDDVIDVFGTAIGRKLLAADDLCINVGAKHPGAFTWTLNERTYDVRVAYNRERKRYELDCKELERDYVRLEGTGPNLIAQLNRDQAFRIVPSMPNVIYAHGRFYAPKLRLGGSQKADKLDLFEIFETLPRLSELNHEKFPARRDQTGWTGGTVFHLIDSRGGQGTKLAKAMKGLNLLVCDDAGANEIADFIAADIRNRRIVLIHAKAARETRLLSASAFADVCNQAVKNLDVLTPFSTVEPPNLHAWGNQWRTSWKDKPQTVTNRLRRGAKSPLQAWKAFQSIIRDPASTREVWIVVGNTFSKQAFRQAAEQASQPPEVIQLLYSLQSTWGAISSVGARLRVFCSP